MASMWCTNLVVVNVQGEPPSLRPTRSNEVGRASTCEFRSRDLAARSGPEGQMSAARPPDKCCRGRLTRARRAWAML
eukprot:4931394-Prymnesium_polylepis.1